MKIGLQLWTLREQMQDASQTKKTLQRIQSIGFDCVELGSLEAFSAEDLRKWLKEAGLQAVSCSVGFAEICPEHLPTTIRRLHTVGATSAMLSWLDETWRTPAGYIAAASHIETAARSLAKENIALRYHNHDFEFERHFTPEGKGQTGFEILVSRFEQTRVELDIGWLAHAGCAPLVWLDRFASQIDWLHLRDAGVRHSKPTTLPFGRGVVDWQSLFAHPVFRQAPYGFIEHCLSEGDPFSVLSEALAAALSFSTTKTL